MLHRNELGSQWEAEMCIKVDGMTAKFKYPCKLYIYYYEWLLSGG